MPACENCGKPAMYAIEEADPDWVDLFLCNYCIELWFPDGPDRRHCRPIPDTSLPDPSIVSFRGRVDPNHRSWWQRLTGGHR